MEMETSYRTSVALQEPFRWFLPAESDLLGEHITHMDSYHKAANMLAISSFNLE